MGPRTLTWGTPDMIGNKGKTSSFTLFRNCQLLGYDSNSGKNDGRWFFILYNSPGCQTLSKAWLTSRNTDVQYSLLFKALRMVWVILWHCWIVEWARRNPNWWWGIQSLVEKLGSILQRIKDNVLPPASTYAKRCGHMACLSRVSYHHDKLTRWAL